MPSHQNKVVVKAMKSTSMNGRSKMLEEKKFMDLKRRVLEERK